MMSVYTILMVSRFLSLLVKTDLSTVEFHQKYESIGLVVGDVNGEMVGLSVGRRGSDTGDLDGGPDEVAWATLGIFPCRVQNIRSQNNRDKAGFIDIIRMEFE